MVCPFVLGWLRRHPEYRDLLFNAPRRPEAAAAPASRTADMTDYGHPLRFGSFITPSAASPQRGVELAVLSEELGYDLATFQDHPYQPSFLDTWTLMSYAAARTERIQLSGNVVNLPLRPPAVLAKSVASLDLLSGGRVALGLGAGGFWDAIEAYGGTRLAPGEAVDALAEAIAIIRGVWDTSERSVLAVDGLTTGSAGPSAVPRRRTTYRSGSAPSSRGCCA